MNITFKQLEACYWASRLGSFAIAAERLNITQPTLSKRIFELESELGCQLFDRSGRRAHTTDAGDRLTAVASRILSLTEDLSFINEQPAQLRGTCCFGVSEMVALTWLPRLLIRVRQQHPDLLVRPYVDLAGPLEEKVLRGELDFAVAPGPERHQGLQRRLVRDVTFGWMTAPARRPVIDLLTPEHLSEATVITLTEGSGLVRNLDRWCAAQGVEVRKTIACNNLTTIVGFTIAGLGISFLPIEFTESCVRDGLLQEIASVPPFPSLGYYFISRSDDHRALIHVLHQYVDEVADFSDTNLKWTGGDQ